MITLLAQVTTTTASPDEPTGLIHSTGYAQDILMVLGAGLVLLVLLIVWAVYLRRRSHNHRHHHHHRSEAPGTPSARVDEADATETTSTTHHHHRRRRVRREHRGRNPTLAETGGLPPPRPEGSPPPVP